MTWGRCAVQYCVQYAGTAADREVIQKHELYGMTGKQRTGIKFNVLLTSYEMLLRDEKILGRISYDTVIIDEAHVSIRVCNGCRISVYV